RSRLAPLYAEVIRAAADLAGVESRKAFRLEGDDAEKLKQRLGDLLRTAQGRLDEVSAHLELEAGTEEFEAAFRRFRGRYLRRLTAVAQPVGAGGLPQGDAEAQRIDLYEDVSELK